MFLSVALGFGSSALVTGGASAVLGATATPSVATVTTHSAPSVSTSLIYDWEYEETRRQLRVRILQQQERQQQAQQPAGVQRQQPRSAPRPAPTPTQPPVDTGRYVRVPRVQPVPHVVLARLPSAIAQAHARGDPWARAAVAISQAGGVLGALPVLQDIATTWMTKRLAHEVVADLIQSSLVRPNPGRRRRK